MSLSKNQKSLVQRAKNNIAGLDTSFIHTARKNVVYPEHNHAKLQSYEWNLTYGIFDRPMDFISEIFKMASIDNDLIFLDIYLLFISNNIELPIAHVRETLDLAGIIVELSSSCDINKDTPLYRILTFQETETDIRWAIWIVAHYKLWILRRIRYEMGCYNKTCMVIKDGYYIAAATSIFGVLIAILGLYISVYANQASNK